MKKNNLQNMTKGWFIGNFFPSIINTTDFEVAVKYYNEGDYETKHYHKISSEITVIVEGKVKMFDKVFKKGDIISIEPLESTDFLALKKTITVVVKVPSSNNDKYISN